MTNQGNTQNNEGTVPRKGTPWRVIWLALGLSIVGTAVLGGVLFVAVENVWLITLAGILSLFGGGAYMGWRSGEAEPLYGSLLAILYFALVVFILFSGSLAGTTLVDVTGLHILELPDPLPGLAFGDSTLFFVSPLLMLVAGVAGSVVGGHLPRRIDVGN